tara:strand:+ start:361 stop:525 length:165 start_codon:yes stop_codon:yes gene_type:complete
MQVKILSSTAASGKDLLVGAIATVSDKDGQTLISMGKAEAYTAPVAPVKAKKKG